MKKFIPLSSTTENFIIKTIFHPLMISKKPNNTADKVKRMDVSSISGTLFTPGALQRHAKGADERSQRTDKSYSSCKGKTSSWVNLQNIHKSGSNSMINTSNQKMMMMRDSNKIKR
ncbi:hypothetical protein OIU84_029644 [Salix udensis]|uniref:Uncharacterized protein n=1 Tax=Salix udensis TaxID=889485 RepID=A0AAD6P813_9ROSI|nr:hypothetical protein OIU84_029644 [Salix udensis]